MCSLLGYGSHNYRLIPLSLSSGAEEGDDRAQPEGHGAHARREEHPRGGTVGEGGYSMPGRSRSDFILVLVGEEP